MQVMIQKSFVHGNQTFVRNQKANVSEHTAKQWIVKGLAAPFEIVGAGEETESKKNVMVAGVNALSSAADLVSPHPKSTKLKSGAPRKARKKKGELS